MSNNKSELRDTAILGATGALATGLAHPLTDKLTGKAVKNATPFGERLAGALRNPIKSVGSAIKHEGFRKGLAVGAVGGGLGLIGDYAGVKLNNHLAGKQVKEASATPNKYIEKIAGLIG